MKSASPQRRGPDWLYRLALRVAGLLPTGVRRRLRRHLPDAEVVIEDATFCLRPSDNYTEYRLFLTQAASEPKSIAALGAQLKGLDALMIDIGANCGVYSVLMARAMGQGGRVIAIEPNPEMAARLGRNVDVNDLGPRVQIEQVALGPEAGEAVLTLNPGNLGGSSLLEGGPGKRVRVEQKTLLDLIRAAGQTPLAIKIDVEGFEDQVLGPYLAEAEDAELPSVLLMETEHSEDWRDGLLAQLADRGFEPAGRHEFNTLFVHKSAATI